MKIAINLIATNKYVYFVKKIVESLDNFFFQGNQVTVLVHTNSKIPEGVTDKFPRIVFIENYIEHEPWPSPTLKRFDYFLSVKDILESNDYCFYIDVDSEFIKPIGDEILPESGMIGTIHPCFGLGQGTPERNSSSRAFIHPSANNRYFCGGFFGGKSEDFIRATVELSECIKDDSSRGVTAVWHDESHLNRFFFENPPTVILENPFAIGENLSNIDDLTKIMFLDKSGIGGHAFFRS